MDLPPPRLRAPSLLAVAAALAASGAFAAHAAPGRGESSRPASAARVLARHVEGGYETLVVSVDAGACSDSWNRGWHVRLDGAAGEPMPWSGVATQPHGEPRAPVAAAVTAAPAPTRPTLTLVVRRVTPTAPASSKLHVYSPASCGSSTATVGEHLLFTLPDTSGLPDDPQALSTYLLELGQKLRFGSAFSAFAQARLHMLAEERFKATAPPAPRRPSRQELRKLGVVGFGYRDVGTAPARPTPSAPRRTPGDLAALMSSTAAATSLQALIQQDGRLAAYVDERATIPIDKVDRPTFTPRPWRELQAGLAQPAPAEPLADATPADFYFARFSGPQQLLQAFKGGFANATELLGSALSGADVGERIASPTSIDRALTERYLTELGLPPGLPDALQASGISGELAIVGSDPYLREGSDLTLIWRPQDRSRAPGADTTLKAALAGIVAVHGEVAFDDRDERGVAVHAARSADGAIHQYRASAGGFELCSNSPGAIRRVLAAIAGRAPRLGDEYAFRYLLGRDAGAPAEGLLFVGERFLARVLGAPMKVLEARRQLALGEMQTPGLAALLFGWINGRAPTSLDELLAWGLLRRDELAHGGRDSIAWMPGTAVWSSWGTPSALTPLIDLPAPTVVTVTERDAYRIFLQGYERDWRAAVGPIAVRIGPLRGTVDTLDVRMAPFADGGGGVYAALARVAGEARLAGGRSQAGARVAIGLDPGGEPRRWLRDLLAPAFVGRPPPAADWLGDWVMVGVEDSRGLASLWRGGRASALGLLDLLHVGPDSPGVPLDLPIFAGIAVRDEADAEVFLRNARAGIDPTHLEWRASGQYRGVAVTRVRAAAGQAAPMRPVYYAVCRSTLVVALSEQTLRHCIDDCLDGRLPRLEAKPKLKPAEIASVTAAGGTAGAHLVADVGLLSTGSLWVVVGDLLDQVAPRDDGAGIAEAIFRGAPALDAVGARALARAYLGGVPVTREGLPFSWSEAGIASPMRGSAFAPRASADGAAGPMLRSRLDAFANARLEISLDREPAPAAGEVLRSVHVRLTGRGPR